MTSSLASDISVEIVQLMRDPEPKIPAVEGERVVQLENAVLGLQSQLDILLENSYFKENDKTVDLSKKLTSINRELEALKSQIYQPEPKKERYVLQTIKNYRRSDYTPKIDKTNYIKTPVLMPRQVGSPTMRHDIHEYYMNSPQLNKPIADDTKIFKSGLDMIHDNLGKSIESTREILIETNQRSNEKVAVDTVNTGTIQNEQAVEISVANPAQNEINQSSALNGKSRSKIEIQNSINSITDLKLDNTNEATLNQTATSDYTANVSSSILPSQSIQSTDSVKKENSFDLALNSQPLPAQTNLQPHIQARYFHTQGIQVPSRETSISNLVPALKLEDTSNTRGTPERLQKKSSTNLSVLPQFPYQDHNFKEKSSESEPKSILKSSSGNLADLDQPGGLTPQVKNFIRTEIQLHIQSFIQHQFPGILGGHLDRFESRVMEKIAAKQVKWDFDNASHTSTVSSSNLINLQNEKELELESLDSKPSTPTITDLLSNPTNIGSQPTTVDKKQDINIPRIPSQALKNPYEVIYQQSVANAPTLSQQNNSSFEAAFSHSTTTAAPQQQSPKETSSKRVPSVIHREAVDIPDTEENAERLLRKLRNKLNYKAKLERELQSEKIPKPKSPRSEHFQKPTLASQLKKRAFYI
ncbi:hypothetical protein HDV06_003541 [Boothiomyces sp. JEL0866]|nr:hypothetical protein HDV06_003541 [Boothiomyces sp. JEL0866]